MCKKEIEINTPAAKQMKQMVFLCPYFSKRRMTQMPAEVTDAAKRLAPNTGKKVFSILFSLKIVRSQ